MSNIMSFKLFAALSILLVILLTGCDSEVAAEPTPTSIPMAPDYNTVLEYYRSGITDMQRLNYQETKLLGHRVEWSGWVINSRDDLNNFKKQIIVLDMSGDTGEFGGKINLIGLDEVFGSEAQVDLRLYFSGIVEEIGRDGTITVRVDSLMDNPQAGSIKIESYDSLLLAFQTLDNRDWMRIRQNSIGTKVNWVGYVVNVTEDGVVLLSSHPDSEEDMELSGLSSEKALHLSLGQEYSFSATIVKVDYEEVIMHDKMVKKIVVYLNAGDLGTPTPDLTLTPME
ncbi:MAG: hypothetical protein JEZ00_20845 [Anaerolineaceae bacterium]|nr:hypothetical protein [Anaerolineaceae bacterium]